MRFRVPNSTLRRGGALAVLVAGMVLPLGCAQRGGESAFRRFWGFDHAPSHTLDSQHVEPRFTNILPKFWGEHWTENPFLKSAEPISEQELAGTDGFSDAGNSFDPAAVPPLPAVLEPPDDPVRLAQHQTAVHDLSPPAPSEPAIERVPTEPPEFQSPSQLERLKIAIRHDAKTPLAPKDFDQTKTARRRVATMMQTARREMQVGEYEDALRWAIAAEQLAEGAELFFGPDEDLPGDLVRTLQDRLKLPYAPPPAPPLPTESTSTSDQNPQPPELSIEFPTEKQPPAAELLAPVESGSESKAHATSAMKEAAVAPETLIPAPPTEARIAPGQRHRRTFKVDARRVSANQGATVTVEGQLNPPADPPLPDLPLAPPAAEESALPPVELAMTDPSLMTTPAPPLPPPNSVETPRFLYAGSANLDSPPAPVKNVRWNEAPPPAPEELWFGWIFPVVTFAGILLFLGVFAWRRLRV